jgi:nucleoside-diphosphate-sugar epimerase
MELVMGVHDFCYIDDFVNGIDSVLKSNCRTPGELINISSGVQSSNSDVLEAFRQATGKEGAVTLINKFVTPSMWKADVSHVKNKYHWQPKYSLLDGVTRMIGIANYKS